MNLTIAKAAEILKVDNGLIKKWAYHFSEHLSRSVNPEKGVTRLFSGRCNSFCIRLKSLGGGAGF